MNRHPDSLSLVTSTPTSERQRRIVAELDALKRLPAETAADRPAFHFGATGLDAFPPSPSFRLHLIAARQVGATGDRAFTRLHVISARREGEL